MKYLVMAEMENDEHEDALKVKVDADSPGEALEKVQEDLTFDIWSLTDLQVGVWVSSEEEYMEFDVSMVVNTEVEQLLTSNFIRFATWTVTEDK